MNTKIFSLINKNLCQAFSLPKYQNLTIDYNTVIDNLPWSPARRRKFESSVLSSLAFTTGEFSGTVAECVDRFDRRYMNRFFTEIWKPNLDRYQFSGWEVADRVNQMAPKKVLDIGCGYNLLKDKIPNLIGIDPYNSAADYMVSLDEFVSDDKSFDVILALGSLNFGSVADISAQFNKTITLLKSGGLLILRLNPGQQWNTAPYVDIFPWSFETVSCLCRDYSVNLLKYKHDCDRIYCEISK